jgi:hypothetical protein
MIRWKVTWITYNLHDEERTAHTDKYIQLGEREMNQSQEGINTSTIVVTARRNPQG